MMSDLTLPQFTASFSEAVAASRVLVLGGKAPDPDWLRQTARGRDVWAVDRGAEACRDADVKPDYALGDFDSISDAGKKWLDDGGVETDSYESDKDLTDFQLALRGTSGKKSGLLVTGCWGGRFDHAFSNVFSVLLGDDWGVNVIALADESETLIPLRAGGSLTVSFRSKPLALSLLPLSPVCRGVTLCGAKWNLRDATLTQSRPCAVSNVAQRDEVTVKVDSGTLGVYCFFLT
jgi:thiamine pyrophosphokinase